VIYMRAGYIAVLGTLFLYACLLSWRRHRLIRAVARAEASRDSARPPAATPPLEDGMTRAVIAPPLSGSPVAHPEGPPEVGR